jgi:hypothetical protein
VSRASGFRVWFLTAVFCIATCLSIEFTSFCVYAGADIGIICFCLFIAINEIDELAMSVSKIRFMVIILFKVWDNNLAIIADCPLNKRKRSTMRTALRTLLILKYQYLNHCRYHRRNGYTHSNR